MITLNKVLIIGILTNEPIVKYSSSGIQITSVRMAVNNTYKTKNGEKVEETCYVTANAFGTLAKTISSYVKKGNQLLVEGKLQSKAWLDKHQDKKVSLEILVEKIGLFPGNKENKPVETVIETEVKDEPVVEVTEAVETENTEINLD